MNLELRIKNYKKILLFCCFVVLLFCQINITMAATCSDGGGVCLLPDNCGEGNYIDNSATGCNAGEACCKQTPSASIVGNINCAKEAGSVSECGLNDFLVVAVNVANWILGITGSLALLMFIYGGAVFLISSGNTEQVTKAKQIIIGSIIGLVIVFSSWLIIDFVFKAVGLPDDVDWSSSDWFSILNPN